MFSAKFNETQRVTRCVFHCISDMQRCVQADFAHFKRSLFFQPFAVWRYGSAVTQCFADEMISDHFKSPPTTGSLTSPTGNEKPNWESKILPVTANILTTFVPTTLLILNLSILST